MATKSLEKKKEKEKQLYMYRKENTREGLYWINSIIWGGVHK